MPDEAKDHDALTNNGATARATPVPIAPPAASQIDEAVILEEHITPHNPPQNPTPAPNPSVPLSSTAAIPTSPTPPIPGPIPPPKATISAPETPIPVEPHPLAPTIRAQDPTEAAATVANILQAVKLPERYSQKGSADAKIPPPSTAPSTEAEPAPAVARTPPTQNASTLISPVHTLKDDLVDVSREQKMSLVHAVSLEEDRRAHTKGASETPAVQKQTKKTFTILLAVVLLLVIGGGLLFTTLSLMKKPGDIAPAMSSSSLLFAEASVTLPLTNNSPIDVRSTLRAQRTSNDQTLGSITRILPYVTIKDADGNTQDIPATFSQFMKSLGGHIPDDLLRALGDEFFLGLHTIDKNAPLMIIPVKSYDRAFAGMLAWEPSLNTDLVPLFTEIPSITNQDELPQTRLYQDLVIRNHDVRALKDDRGEIQLYYSFPNQNTLVIAESPYSFTEILSRLQAERKL